MRLIDADALKKRAIEMEIFQPYGGDGSVMGVTVDHIDFAPTIDAEPVRHGAWEYNHGDNIPYCNMCAMPQDVPTNFCHSCGAKMDLK